MLAMKCESCEEREATIIFTRVAGDDKQTLHLCPACASKGADKQAGQSHPAPPESDVDQEAPSQPPSGKVVEVKKVNVVVGHLSPVGAQDQTRCPQCGTSYEEFRKAGRFGCGQCYEAFASQLGRLFKRIHGAQVHSGKGPAQRRQSQSPADDLSQLRQELQEAVESEAYERAADLRDRISLIEGEAGEARSANAPDAPGRQETGER